MIITSEIASYRQHLRSGARRPDRFQVGVVGEVLQQPGQFVEPGRQVIGRVEADAVRCQHGEVLDGAVRQVTPGAGRERVGELVFVHVERDGHVAELAPGQRQKGRQVGHARGQQQIGPVPGGDQGSRLFRQFHRPAVHPPFPEVTLHPQDMHPVAAVRGVALGPGAVGTGGVGVEQPDVQR